MRICAGVCVVSAVVTGTLITALAATTATAATAATTATAATMSGPSPVVHRFSEAVQTAASHYWTPSSEAAASAWGSPAKSATSSPWPEAGAQAQPSPPPGTPNPQYFAGLKTVGALFFTTGTQNHFCTASVVDSSAGDLVLTAAHCVAYGNGVFAQNVVYVPKYHNGLEPYGAWPVREIAVTSAWNTSGDINDDFAFLAVSPPTATQATQTTHEIQAVTGGLRLGVNLPYDVRPAFVIGYNNTDNYPIICQTKSFEFTPTQIEFYCNNYNDGTSGGPWIKDLDPLTGSGIVYGDIGGFEQGGNYPWQSFSPYYSTAISTLFQQAEQA